MPMFSADGRFDPKAFDVLRRSYLELHLLEQEPDLAKYCTEAYLPPATGG